MMIAVENNGTEPINSYALVAYIPDPLGSFLDHVRCDLVPSCVPNAHVTILPPRPISASPDEAWEEIHSHLRDLPPFTVELRDVEIFGRTSVIYIGLGAGLQEFKEMHDSLNTGALFYNEPYPYHPHVTLAQELACEQVMGVYETARRRWAEFGGVRRFKVETITFVQNTKQNLWLDLAHCTLGAVPSMR